MVMTDGGVLTAYQIVTAMQMMINGKKTRLP